MSIREILRRIRYLIRRDRFTDDLREEMRLHLELRAAALQREGLAAPDASAAARRRFGNVSSMQERSRDMWRLETVDHVFQDLRYALRRLRKRPGFSAPILSVLALGIRATTAVFSA